MAKNTHLRKVLGEERYRAVRSAKVLMVGAGGIGCELLKDLLLAGFGEIHIVDLDTITLSNLNRQFLFRQKDIGKSKALTVADAVQSFNFHGATLTPHHGNVMDSALFPVEWWRQFDFIYNALDNLEARRHVNTMALFLRKPLMESGTTGFDGQIQPIFPYATECFECQQKATPQTFPVCTIRSTPSQPVHCIIWAKEYLFTQLFGSSSENELSATDLSKETSDPQEIERILSEANELSVLKKKIASDDFAVQVITKIYEDDVCKALRLESLWKNREKPTPLGYRENYEADLQARLASPACEALLAEDTKQWSVLDNLYVLHKATQSLQARIRGGETEISFDKDDEDTLNFVAAAANLRSYVFHIACKTKFDIKQIAGNIIPAIATTNAIISGFSAISSLSFWNSNFDPAKWKTTFISIKENKRATSALVAKPNPRCASSGTVKKGILKLPENALGMTLKEFVELVSDRYFPGDIAVILSGSRLIYDYDFDDSVGKKLSEIKGFGHNDVVLIKDEEDEVEDLELMLVVDNDAELQFPAFELGPKLKEQKEEEEEEEEIVVDDEPATKKRKFEDVEVL